MHWIIIFKDTRKLVEDTKAQITLDLCREQGMEIEKKLFIYYWFVICLNKITFHIYLIKCDNLSCDFYF